ncbi:MAG: PD-(D/E)XK nuclease family protein [Actinomycetota bacterium]
MSDDLVTGLLPVLGRPLDLGFNVFDVMPHGGHEKQISNVFRWLLNSEGTHNLGDRFVRIFIDEVNQALVGREPFPDDGYWVRQEVNTSGPGEGADIADLVLESNTARFVIENYFTSDGHGHDYNTYLKYAERNEKCGVVVLLCQDEDSSLQTLGWENAPVLTYRKLLHRLVDEVDNDYPLKNPEAFSLIEQMHRKFVKGRGRVEDQDVLNFVIAMCDTGEAGRYGFTPQDVAAEQFASDLAEQAKERFGEGRELLQRAKDRLKNYSDGTLKRQLNESRGDGFVRNVSAMAAGIYRWTVGFDLAAEPSGVGEGTDPKAETDDGAQLQFKFGPSAWYANEKDSFFTRKVDPEIADYSHLFLTRTRTHEIRQSDVTIQEILDGLDPKDRRLHDEIVQLLSDN